MVQRNHILFGVMGLSLVLIGYWAGSLPSQRMVGTAPHVVNVASQEAIRDVDAMQDAIRDVDADAVVIYEEPRPPSSCTFDFVRYESSPWELEWLAGVNKWGGYDTSQTVYCDKVRSEKDKVTDVLAGIAQMAEARSTTLPDTSRNRELFSRFIFEEKCPGKEPRTVERLIEPLAQALRKFGSICISDDILGRDYIVFDTDKGRPARAQNFYLDLGASTWTAGAGGLSQRWFFEEYAAREMPIDRALMWEVESVVPQVLFDAVPDKYLHAYQYFNIPCEVKPGHGKNPLTMIQTITTPDDFVVLKIDIDTPYIENQLTAQLVEGVQEFSKVIDEFFYEHHVHFRPMMSQNRWGDVKVDGVLADTYKMHLTLRQAGIRSHGWP